MTIHQVHQESPRKTAVTAVSLHPKKVSLPVSCAGQSLFASQADLEVAVAKTKEELVEKAVNAALKKAGINPAF